MGERKVCGHFFDGYWEDIGTIRSFFEAHMDLTRPLPQVRLLRRGPADLHPCPGSCPAPRSSASDVEHAILCEGSIVNRSRIRDSIVGIRSRIGESCRSRPGRRHGRRLLRVAARTSARNRDSGLPDVGIGRDCEIRNAIIDKNARIGHGVRLVNRDGVAADESADDLLSSSTASSSCPRTPSSPTARSSRPPRQADGRSAAGTRTRGRARSGPSAGARHSLRPAWAMVVPAAQDDEAVGDPSPSRPACGS
ncbi:MAG: hypothetical protein MZV64_11885 [Ignavibacteriales bacterium]|nr:hypothetical protein [Ignavibacteriales bacterium]